MTHYFNLISSDSPSAAQTVEQVERYMARRVAGAGHLWIPAHPAIVSLLRSIYRGPVEVSLPEINRPFTAGFLFDGEEA